MKNKNIYLLLIPIVLFSFCKKKIDFIEVIPPKEKIESKKTDTNQENKIQNQQEEIHLEERIIKPEKQIDRRAGITPTDDKWEIYQTGIASWYGGFFHGRDTASGEVYDKNELSAAHKTLPFGTIVKIKNLENGKELVLKINDRGPFVKGRIIDLSEEAAKQLGFRNKGTTKVSILIKRNRNIKKIKTHTKTILHPLKQQPSLKQQKYYFYIQAGAYRIKQNALSMVDKLKNILPSANFHIVFSRDLHIVVSKATQSFEKISNYAKILKQNSMEYIIRKRFAPE
jgi:rare lipoprotein A (peptidoglycan hydrolase)